MSLAETKQIFQTLTEIDELLEKINIKAILSKSHFAEVEGKVRELEYFGLRIIGMLHKLGISGNIAQAISMVEKLIFMVRSLQSLIAFGVGGNPIYLLIGLVTAFGSVGASLDYMMSE